MRGIRPLAPHLFAIGGGDAAKLAQRSGGATSMRPKTRHTSTHGKLALVRSRALFPPFSCPSPEASSPSPSLPQKSNASPAA